jgi:hypothetical protein
VKHYAPNSQESLSMSFQVKEHFGNLSFSIWDNFEKA